MMLSKVRLSDLLTKPCMRVETRTVSFWPAVMPVLVATAAHSSPPPVERRT